MAAKQLKASIIIDLMGNVSQKSKQFGESIDRMAKRSSAAFKSMGESAKYMGDTLDKFATRSVLTITAASAALDKTFIKTAAMFERYQIQSAQLFGGATQGKNALDWAKQNAKDTVLSLEQVMQLMTEMKGFGMDPMGGKLRIMENIAAQRGWGYDKLHGAMLQFEQMFARQKITQEDAGILSTYGIDVYKEIAKASGVAEKRVRAFGGKGLLGQKAFEIIFRQMDKESKGASASAMKTWDGMISNLGDDWQQFQENVMNRGVFDKLKGKVRQIKNLIENPDKANSYAHNTAAMLNHSIDAATASAEGLWEVFKGISATIDGINTTIKWASGAIDKTSDTVNGWLGRPVNSQSGSNSTDDKSDHSMNSVKYLTEGIVSLWLAKKVFDIGKPLAKMGWLLGKGGFKLTTAPFKGMRWAWRKIFGGGKPGSENEIPGLPGAGSEKVMRVFVTNWPGSGIDPDDFGSDGGNGKRKGKKARRRKGPGKGRGRFSRIIGAGEEVLEDVEHVSGKSGIWGRVKSLFHGGGRVAKSIPLLSAGMAAVDVATADTNAERGGAIGGSVGAWVGGALGTLTDEFTGPFGTIVGAQIGESLGDKLGALIGGLFDDDKKAADSNPQSLNGRIDLNLNLPPGVSMDSSLQSFNGSNPFNLTTGGWIP